MMAMTNGHPAETNGEAVPVVYLVEDDPSMRQSIRTLVESVGYECRPHAAGQPFLDDVEGAPCTGGPAAVILDLRLPDMSGMTVLERLEQRGGRVPPIVFVTGHGDLQTAVSAMKSDLVLDFIEKPFYPNRLLQLVHDAVDRDRERLAAHLRREESLRRLASLSRRERQVLEELLAGKSNKEVALDLNLSHKTISTHRTHILQKFGARSIVDVAVELRDEPAVHAEAVAG